MRKTMQINGANLFKGFFRLSLLITILSFVIWAYIRMQDPRAVAFGISNNDARELRNTKHVRINGHEYSYNKLKESEGGIIVNNIYKILDFPYEHISSEERNEALKKCLTYWNRPSYHDKGVISSTKYHCDKTVQKALKRILEKEDEGYSDGKLVSNKQFGVTKSWSRYIDDESKEDSIHEYYEEDGYSIIPSFEYRLKESLYEAGWCAWIAFVLISLLFPSFICCLMFFFDDVDNRI